MQELANISLFKNLTPQELEKLGKIAQRKQFSPNTAVFFEGDRSDALYVIIWGSAKVVQQSDDGREKTLRTLGKGEIFGEFAMIDGQPRSAGVTTLEATEMLTISHRDFRAFATQNPEILWKVLEALCERIRQLSDEMLDVSFKDVPYRLLRKLSELVKKHGVTDQGGLRINVKLSTVDLAGMVASSPDRISRLLTRFEDEGLIKRDGDRIIVTDATALQRAFEYNKDWS